MNENNIAAMSGASGSEFGLEAQARSFEIIVNARPHVIQSQEVTFEQIVQLAFPGAHEPNVVFSTTYRHAASKPHSGELGPGGVVEIKKDTIFNVTRTVQS
jgi:hypothetical protein